MKNSQGFVSLGVILAIIAVIAIAGGAGWYATYQTPAQSQYPTTSSSVATNTSAAFKSIAAGKLLSDSGSSDPADPQVQDGLSRAKFTYFHNGSSVYYALHGAVHPMPEADYATFTILSGSILETDPYALDKNHVYYDGEILKGADPATFVIMPSGAYPTAARDKDNVFCDGISYPLDSGKCGMPSAQISVPGMSKYTDTNFGFAFWYPSGWQVKEVKNQYGDFLQIMNPTDSGIDQYHDGTWVTIEKKTSPVRIDDAARGPEVFTFETKSGSWLDWSDGAGNGVGRTSTPQSGGETTLAHYQTYGCVERYGCLAIPLNNLRMLVLYSSYGASTFVQALAQTITPLDAKIDSAILNSTAGAELKDHYFLQEQCRKQGIDDSQCRD